MMWLVRFLGLDDSASRWYLWWSGVGANLGELAIFGGLFASYKRHTCHVNHPRSCWRLGVHPVGGTPYRTCGRHHPTVPNRVSVEHVADEHRQGGDKG